jgi:predicted lipoprotein with Yx(FWY)xxD motif
MRNTGWMAGGLIAVALGVAACGTSSATTSGGGAYGSNAYGAQSPAATSGTSGGSTLTSTSSNKGGLMKVKRTKLGYILANPHGLTVYYHTADKPGSGKSVCTGSCAAAWPPVGYPDRIPAGVKLPLKGTLGFITRPGGFRQLTINGWPIYKYAGDKAPGQVNGNGVGGVWFVVKVKVGSTAMTGPAPSSAPSPSSGGYGY